MASIIKRIDIYPNKDYQKFLDFAYDAKNRLLRGESANTIFKNLPEGFEDWLEENFMKIFRRISLHQLPSEFPAVFYLPH